MAKSVLNESYIDRTKPGYVMINIQAETCVHVTYTGGFYKIKDHILYKLPYAVLSTDAAKMGLNRTTSVRKSINLKFFFFHLASSG